MKKAVLAGVAGVIVGALLMLLIIFKAAPGMMLKEDASKYDFDQTTQVFEEAVAQMGWKIPTVHDLQETMKKFGKDVRKVKVYELCHPDHAELILKESEERIVSSMMPCRIAIYEKEDGKVYVSRMNSALMSKALGGIVEEVMTVAAGENEEMLESIISR